MIKVIFSNFVKYWHYQIFVDASRITLHVENGQDQSQIWFRHCELHFCP